MGGGAGYSEEKEVMEGKKWVRLKGGARRVGGEGGGGGDLGRGGGGGDDGKKRGRRLRGKGTRITSLCVAFRALFHEFD